MWKPVHGARSAIEKPIARDEWQAEPVVLVSSFLMRRAERQRELLDAADWNLLILDEAHHARRRGAGSTQERGPNALLALMRKLQVTCSSLVLLIIVFTPYTDTMEYLRDYLADQMHGIPVACYCGAGGAWRDASGQWVPCSKEEIKRRLRDRQVRVVGVYGWRRRRAEPSVRRCAGELRSAVESHEGRAAHRTY